MPLLTRGVWSSSTFRALFWVCFGCFFGEAKTEIRAELFFFPNFVLFVLFGVLTLFKGSHPRRFDD